MSISNVFLENKGHDFFDWESLGDIEGGRGDLGTDVPVLVYRLMQFTILDVLSKAYGLDIANKHFREAGFLAGSEYAKNTMDLKVDFNTFIADFQKSLQNLKIGILRVEALDIESGDAVLTVAQDLDCSGLPITHENVCSYDEGFIAGVLETFSGKHYDVREVDCWASGARVCRFIATCVRAGSS